VTDSAPAAAAVQDSDAGRWMRRATYASMTVAVTLIAVKVFAWTATGSVSLLSSLLDSMLDALASVVSFLAVRHALEPADHEHRFGHGKAEALAGLAQAAFITGSAVVLIIEAGDRLIHPQPVANSTIGYAVMGFSIVATLALVAFQKFVIRRTASVAIKADSAHYTMDLLVNVGVIVSLFLSTSMGLGFADPLIALAIAAYILHGAWEIGAESYDMLMDRELPDDDRTTIRGICLAHPEVHGVHDIRTRQSGPQVFIQLHLELDGEMKLNDVHEISEAVMVEIMDAFPNAEVIIHEDPEGVDEVRAEFA
jgi:ferrous-iron efflux pump FieF